MLIIYIYTKICCLYTLQTIRDKLQAQSLLSSHLVTSSDPQPAWLRQAHAAPFGIFHVSIIALSQSHLVLHRNTHSCALGLTLSFTELSGHSRTVSNYSICVLMCRLEYCTDSVLGLHNLLRYIKSLASCLDLVQHII